MKKPKKLLARMSSLKSTVACANNRSRGSYCHFYSGRKVNKIVNHYKKLNLPINIKNYYSIKNIKNILSFMKKDKKNNNNKINLVLLKKIGNVN